MSSILLWRYVTCSGIGWRKAKSGRKADLYHKTSTQFGDLFPRHKKEPNSGTFFLKSGTQSFLMFSDLRNRAGGAEKSIKGSTFQMKKLPWLTLRKYFFLYSRGIDGRRRDFSLSRERWRQKRGMTDLPQ